MSIIRLMQEAQNSDKSFISFNITKSRNLKKVLAISLMIVICTMVLQPTIDATAKKGGGGGGGGGKSGGNSGGNSGNSHAGSNDKSNDVGSEHSNGKAKKNIDELGVFPELAPSFEYTAEESLSSEEPESTDYVPGTLIIKFQDGTGENIQNAIINAHGAKVKDDIKQISTKIITVPEEAMDNLRTALEKIPIIEYVETDSIIQPTVMPNDKEFPKQWHLSKINAPKAWDVTIGSSETLIAVIDTGFDLDHPDLADKFTVGYNAIAGSSDVSPHPCGHGTKTAGITAAMTNNDLGVAGMGWNNKILPIKVVGSRCYSTSSILAHGVVYAADHGAKVANLSWEINAGDRTITSAAKYMNRAGGVVIASSGNSGQEIKSRDNPSIISVGATRSDDTLASFSTRGGFVDFTAPGFNIWTTCVCIRDIITNSTGTYYVIDYYGSASGTSFSAPIVSGIAGLIYSEQPNTTPKEVYEILKQSSIDLGDSGYDTGYGWGRIDANKALQIIQSQQIQNQQVTTKGLK